MPATTLVLHVRATDLNDALSFNRLKGDVKKIFPLHRLAIVHSGDAPANQDAQSVERLATLNKTFAAKLSEELLPAVSLAAHHLGIATIDWSSDAQEIEANLVIKPNALTTMLERRSLPIIAPIVKDRFRKETIAKSEWVAAKVAAAIQADLLIFLVDAKDAMQAKKAFEEQAAQPFFETIAETRCAKDSLRAGTKRAFVTDIGGMENIALHNQTAPTEIFDHNP